MVTDGRSVLYQQGFEFADRQTLQIITMNTHSSHLLR